MLFDVSLVTACFSYPSQCLVSHDLHLKDGGSKDFLFGFFLLLSPDCFTYQLTNALIISHKYTRFLFGKNSTTVKPQYVGSDLIVDISVS